MSTVAQALQMMSAASLMICSEEREIYALTYLPNIKVKRGQVVKVRDRKENPKIGRNHLCSCGSGLKFKRCCNLNWAK